MFLPDSRSIKLYGLFSNSSFCSFETSERWNKITSFLLCFKCLNESNTSSKLLSLNRSENKITNELAIAVLEKKVAKLENELNKLKPLVDTFMTKWGPDVQKRRDERDERWDEMVRVLTIQEMNKHKGKK